MNYATLKTHDTANGPGVRVSLFVSGCTHYCKGCFNQEAWDFNYGEEFAEATMQKIIDALEPWYIKGFSLLGGEPFEPQNQATVLEVLRKVKETYPQKTIWCYTGYDYEKDLLTGSLPDYDVVQQILSYVDILVDGEFVETLKDPQLRFRGSSNQRIICVKDSLAQDKIVLWDEA